MQSIQSILLTVSRGDGECPATQIRISKSFTGESMQYLSTFTFNKRAQLMSESNRGHSLCLRLISLLNHKSWLTSFCSLSLLRGRTHFYRIHLHFRIWKEERILARLSPVSIIRFYVRPKILSCMIKTKMKTRNLVVPWIWRISAFFTCFKGRN